MRFLKTFVLTGLIGAAAPALADIQLTLNPAAGINFGQVLVGLSQAQNATVGITFDGNGALNGNANNGAVTSVSIINPVGGTLTANPVPCVGTAFSASDPAQTCPVEVTCTPGAVGPLSAQLQVQFELQNMSATQTQTINLSCEGISSPPPGPAPAVSVPALGLLGLGGLGLLLGGSGLLAIRRRRK